MSPLSQSPPAPTSLRERKKQRTRDDIFTAAYELLSERAYDDVTVEEICRRADVAPATFFRIYGTKAGMLREFNSRLADAARLRAEPVAGALARLDAVRAVIVEAWASASPALRDLVWDFLRVTSSADAAASAHPELLALVAEIVADGQVAGELRADLSPRLGAWIIVSSIAAVTTTWLDSPDTALDGQTRAALDAILHGLAT